MLRPFLAVCCALWLATASQAQDTSGIDELIQTVRDARASLEAQYGSGAVGQTLTEAFAANGIGYSMRFADTWSGGLSAEWLRGVGFYLNAERRLQGWRAAVQYGRAQPGDAMAYLTPAMQQFQTIHGVVAVGLQEVVRVNVGAAHWLDLRARVPCCDGPYAFYTNAAAAVRDQSTAPNWHRIGGLQVIPAVADDGTVTPYRMTSERLQAYAESAAGADTPTDRARLTRALLCDLHLSGVPTDAYLSVLLELGANRIEATRVNVSDLLDRAERTEDPDLRAALLHQAQQVLFEQAGVAAPEAVAATLSADGYDAEDLSDLIATTQRLARLRDDLVDGGVLSGLSRGLAGFHAAAELAEAQDEPLLANEMRRLVDDFATAVTPTGPRFTALYAAQMGAVTAQLGATRDAFDAAADAMNGVADAIGGDLSGLDRAEAAAARIQRILDPRRIIAAMTEGAISSVSSLIPGARSWLGTTINSLFS
jgi:hypothetical protein